MANLVLPGQGFWYPALFGDGNGGQIQNFSTMSATGLRSAWIVRLPRAGTINRVGFRVGAVTNNPDNGITISLQTVDATTGNPDGTPDEFRSGVAITANTWLESALLTDDGSDTGVKRTVTQGEIIAVVIEHTTFTAGDSFVIVRNWLGPWRNNEGPIYGTEFNAVSWTKSTSSGANILAIQYDDDIWYPVEGLLPFNNQANASFQDSTNPDERGVKFIAPFDMVVDGAQIWATVATNSSFTLKLYDSGDNLLGSAAHDPDIQPGASINALIRKYWTDTDLVTLTQGETYRLTIRATGTGNVQMNAYNLPSADYATATHWGVYDGEVQGQLTTRNGDGGSWTDTETVIAAFSLHVVELPQVTGGRGLYDARGRYHGRGQYFG